MDLQYIMQTPTDSLIDEFMTKAPTINPLAMLTGLTKPMPQAGIGEGLAPRVQGIGGKPAGQGMVAPPGTVVGTPPPAAPPQTPTPMPLAQGLGFAQMALQAASAPPPQPRSRPTQRYGAATPARAMTAAVEPTRKRATIGDLLGGLY